VVISAVYALFGNVSNRQLNSDILREYTMNIFEKFDKFQHGYLTMEDFLAFCLKVRIEILLKKFFFFDIFLRIQSSFNRLKLYV
jgi:Ca2+-binding EF-hand superfamily protein